MKEDLLNELLREGENTRKLLKAVPDSALNWKPSSMNWTTAKLASHIAGLYDWYWAVVELDELNLDTYVYDRGDISVAANIVAKFEENFEKARKVLESLDESKLSGTWKMTKGGHVAIPPIKKSEALRYTIQNHIYHHRGQLVTYLRASGNTVPGLYGPTAEKRKSDS